MWLQMYILVLLLQVQRRKTCHCTQHQCREISYCCAPPLFFKLLYAFQMYYFTALLLWPWCSCLLKDSWMFKKKNDPVITYWWSYYRPLTLESWWPVAWLLKKSTVLQERVYKMECWFSLLSFRSGIGASHTLIYIQSELCHLEQQLSNLGAGRYKWVSKASSGN